MSPAGQPPSQSPNPPQDPSTGKSGRISLLRAGTIVSSMTMLSRILGFVRDQVLAIFFGAGIATDVFLVAWKIPNFMRKLFAEGAFAQAFVPIFSEYRETKDRKALADLAAHVSGTLIGVLLIVTTLGVMLAPFLIMLFAPGFSSDASQFELATHMLRITFPYLLFVSLLAYAGSILNTFGRFAIPSLTPILLNVCMILSALYLSPYFDQPIVALAWGVLIAGIVQLGFQIPFLRQLNLLPKPRWGWKHSGVRRVLKLMAPVIFGSSVAQLNILLDTIIASFLAVGSLSWLYYSDRLVQFPLGVLGVALATVILPRLSSEHSTDATDDYQKTISWAIKLTLLIGVPAAIGLLLMATPLLSTLFEYGKFSANDTRMAAFSLTAYSFGLPAYILTKIFLPAFFARQNTKTPVRIGIISLVTNMILNLVLVIPMVMLDFIAPHMALAIASTITAWQQAILLYRRLASEGIYRIPTSLTHYALRLLPALTLMALVILWLLPDNFSVMSASQRIGHIVGIIGAAMVSYLIGLWISGVRPSDLAAKH